MSESAAPLRVALDLTQIPRQRTGIGWYAVHLLRGLLELGRLEARWEWVVFYASDDEEIRDLLAAAAHCRPVPVPARRCRRLAWRLLFEQCELPRRCRRLEVDCLLSLHYTMPYLTRLPRVVTVPDMTFYLFPRLHLRRKRLYFKALIPLSLRFSRRIVTISHAAAADITRRFPRLAAEKVRVVHLGVEPAAPPREGETVLARFGLRPRRYILYVGTLEPRKNLPLLIAAFARARREHTPWPADKLVIAGRKGWFTRPIFAAVERHGLQREVVFTDYIDEAGKAALLAGAFLFVYPSLYEGFGLPVLEAMAHGVPVITSSVSSLPEVAGSAALLADPRRVEEWSAAMVRLAADPRVWAEASSRGRERAAAFGWERTAAAMAAVLAEAGGKS